jgi:hypothetical protein
MRLARRAFLTTAGASVLARSALAAEDPILDPDLPIVDPHHHMWDRPGATTAFSHFLLPDLLAQLNSGHKIIATVFIEAGSMYRPDGPAELKSLGETEFATGQAAMSASGAYGPIKAVAGIVGNVDLTLGARAGEIMEMHKRIAGSRFKGIRSAVAGTGRSGARVSRNHHHPQSCVDAVHDGLQSAAAHGGVQDLGARYASARHLRERERETRRLRFAGSASGGGRAKIWRG